MAWLARNNFTAGEAMSHAYLNHLANDIRAWGGDINGGGYALSNVTVNANAYGAIVHRVDTAAGRTNVTLQNGAAANTANRLRIRLSASAGFIGFDVHPYLETFVENAGNNASGLAFGTYTGTGAVVERLRITAAGNIGIGISSPGMPLEVSGTIRSISAGIDLRMAADIGGASGFGTYSNHEVIFIANSAEAMRITASGNLTINKPGGSSVKLAVVGLPTYADNVAANGAGLTAGDFYRTSTGVLMVTY